MFTSVYKSPGDREDRAESLPDGFHLCGDSLDQEPVGHEGHVAGSRFTVISLGEREDISWVEIDRTKDSRGES